MSVASHETMLDPAYALPWVQTLRQPCLDLLIARVAVAAPEPPVCGSMPVEASSGATSDTRSARSQQCNAMQMVLDSLAAQGNCNFTVIGAGNTNGRTPTFCSVLATIHVANWADVCTASQQARLVT